MISNPTLDPDYKCPCCFGTGVEAAYMPLGGKHMSCVGCNGSGHRADFTARMLAGTIQLNEQGMPYEPYQELKLREFYGSWTFKMGKP